MASIPTRWLMLLVLLVARTAMACQFQTVASLGPILVDALAIDFAWVGTLIGLYMLPGTIIALPGGMLGQRFGAKRVVLAGLALMALGGALMGAHSLALVVGGRLISGIGAVFVNVLLTKMIADWFARREIVTAMGILVASWPLGLALGLVSFAPIAGAYGWGAVMHAAAGLVLASLLLVAALYRDPAGSDEGAVARLHIELAPREWLLVSLAGLIWGTYNVAYVVLISFLPDLLTARGYSLPEASRIVSLLGWVLIPSLPLSGYVAERLGRPSLLMLGTFTVVALAAAAMSYGSVLIAPFGLIVLVIGLPAGLIMALPAQAVRPENLAGGMGIFYTWHYAGMAGLPAVAGLTRDLSGSPAAPVAFAAVMMVVAALSLVGFRLAKRGGVESS